MKTKIINKISTPVLAILALIVFGAVNITAAPGDLDLSFGSGGSVVTSFVGSYSVGPNAMLTQPDGKIMVCGRLYDDADNDQSFFLARYHPTGAPDASFGTNGKIISPAFISAMVGDDIALQPDGKIITVGYGAYAGLGFAVRRYNANGTLDTSFGADGLVLTPIGTFSYANSVAIQTDGKIVVVGYSDPTPDFYHDFTVVRYNPDGSLDTSFNGTGKVITSFGSSSAPSAAVLQPDGKIVAGGSARDGNGTYNFALVRYNPDGSLDSGFGTGGKVIHTVSTGVSYLRDVALQPDGKIVATGWINVSGAATMSTIVRYNTNGSIDTNFATNGIFTTESNFNIGNSIALQSNGKLVAFGYADYVTGFAIARLNPNGTPDAGFGTNGRVITPNHRAVADGAAQPDGKILAVAGGYMTDSMEIIRYQGDSAAAVRPAKFDFDGDGRADISVFRPSDRTWYLNQSTAGFSAAQFGLSTDKITPADFDGDGRTDISVFRDGTWYWLASSTNYSFNARQFGIASDIPVPADYTGDGRADLAIYRNGTWWIQDLTNNQTQVVNFGLSTDKAVVADYDGDGRADQAVYRNGEWHLNRSTQGYAVVNFGLATDKPVPADYDGDGKTDQAVYRDGTWYLLRSQAGFAQFQFGIASDIPAPADYDGDGRTDAAVYRDGVWYLLQSASGISIQQFGLANDKPVPSVFLP